MQTLVVLFALVSIAIAAPALPGEGLEVTDRTQDWPAQAQSSLPDVAKREKKSPLEIATSSILHSGASNTEVQNVHNIDSGASTHMGRSFTMKKPLIVKKKYGYRLYRDSDEEKAHADSQEKCGREVKVKLCDEDGKNTMIGSVNGESNIHMSEDDVKHSIKMAKEAVENLQRDIKKMEHNSSMKKAHESEADIELHEDIEVARQALEHIHENFGTLESMSLHATASRDSEAMHDVHLTIAKTEEERMAQWKEAIENIQKNVEIARNIEDSFKSASHQESLVHLGQSQSATTKSEQSTQHHSHIRAIENSDLGMHHVEKGGMEGEFLNKETSENLGEHSARQNHNIEEDMKSAASELVETHEDKIKSQESLRNEGHENLEHEKSAEGKLEDVHAHTENKDFEKKDNILAQDKSSELSVDMLPDQSQHHISHFPSLKAAEEIETKSDMENNASFKTSENILDAHVTTSNIMKPLSSESLTKQQKSAELKDGDDKIENHHLKQEKLADDMTGSDSMIDFLAKSADQLDHDKIVKNQIHAETHHGEVHEKAAETLEKAAENLTQEHEEHHTEKLDMTPKEAHSVLTETNVEGISKQIPKSAEQLDLKNLHNIVEQNTNFMIAKSAEQASLQNHQNQHMIEHEELSHVETHPAMKTAEEQLHHLQHMHNAHWAGESKNLNHLSSMKAAEEFEITHGQGHGLITEPTMDQLRNSHLVEHGQIPSKMGLTHHEFELPSHVQPQYPARYHNSMTHSKLHDMSGMGGAMHSNFHPNMRDAMEGLGSEHMFRWKPTHESARTAYGSGLSSSISSSGGAVGVFPNANTGGCAIPLLLSCSPSVVSGSLAKTHSAGPASYGSSAYRTEDDFTFHNKREVKKTNDIRTTNALRTPIVNQKNPMLLENKH